MTSNRILRHALDSILLGGLAATLVLTMMLSISQGLRITRMSLPFMLGTFITGDLDRVKAYGFGMHLFNGWIFSLVYGLLFEAWNGATWWLGAGVGLMHGLFILTVLMPLLPSLHPRMASEYQQPEPTSLLEPPGFMALHYGPRTPLVMLVAHLVYGLILGALYELQ